MEQPISKYKISRGRAPYNQPNQIDIHVGNVIRIRRVMLKMSQAELGKRLGLTFQQIQKYEKGLNRVGASRLWDISQVLDFPIEKFFASMDKDVINSSPRNLILSQDYNYNPYVDDDPIYNLDNLKLLFAIDKIRNDDIVNDLRSLIGNLAKIV